MTKNFKVNYKFNISEYVEVELTDYGKEILESTYIELDSILKRKVERKKPLPNGRYQFQMWDLMNIYGEYMIMGCEMPFDINIYLSEIEEVKE